jgi:hypothetical protein
MNGISRRQGSDFPVKAIEPQQKPEIAAEMRTN